MGDLGTGALMTHVLLAMVLLAAGAGKGVLSWDADPLQDLCVADVASALHPNGLLCKPSALVQAEDFVYRGLRQRGNSSGGSTGIARKVASVREFPGLNTQGMSIVRVDFEPGGVNPPHLHPRATEIALVGEGIFYSGFVSSDGQLYAQTLQAGDVMVFPRGLVHFQLHVGKGHGVLFGSLNSQNPGTVLLPTTLFGSYLPDDILRKAFQLTQEEVHSLKAKFEKSTPKH